MAKWIVTTDPDEGTPDPIWYHDGSQGEAAEALSRMSSEIGKTLYVWKAMGHSVVDIDVTIVVDDGE